MVLTVNGTLFDSYIAEGGLKVGYEDIDGPNAGRTQTGLMIRDRVATKVRLDVTLRPLTEAQVQVVKQAVAPEFFIVRYHDPWAGEVSKTMYCGPFAVTLSQYDSDGGIWMGIDFALIER